MEGRVGGQPGWETALQQALVLYSRETEAGWGLGNGLQGWDSPLEKSLLGPFCVGVPSTTCDSHSSLETTPFSSRAGLKPDILIREEEDPGKRWEISE